MRHQATADLVLLPDERIGRYRILSKIGDGGMGVVYLGCADGPGGFQRLMAIKVIHAHLSGKQRVIEMFREEARIAARIRHPNVVSVYEVGEESGRPYIAMDYVDGPTLSQALRVASRRGGLPFPIVAHVVASVCDGLEAVHELEDDAGHPMGVVHRDVTPPNIILGYDGVVRLMDFGVAIATDRAEPLKGALKGKCAYMAPEQLRNPPIFDRRVDIFALGTCAWEAITGRRLFKRDNELATLEEIRCGKPPPPSRFRSECPEALERIVAKALAREPDDRFDTATDFGTALRAYLASTSTLCSSRELRSFLRDLFPEPLRRRASTTTERPRSASHTPPDEGTVIDFGLRQAAKLQKTRIEPRRSETVTPPDVEADARSRPTATFVAALENRRSPRFVLAAAGLIALFSASFLVRAPSPSASKPERPPDVGGLIAFPEVTTRDLVLIDDEGSQSVPAAIARSSATTGSAEPRPPPKRSKRQRVEHPPKTREVAAPPAEPSEVLIGAKDL